MLNAAGSAAGTVASGLGNILNAPLRGIRTLGTHETDPDKQREIIRKAQGSEPLYQALGKIPVVGHLAQGTMDTIGDTIEDPLTALSGPVKGATTVGEMGLRAMSATPVGRMMYDFLHWGGPVAREHGPQVLDKVREASNIGSATASKTQNQMVRMFDHVVEGKHVTTGKQFKEPLSAGERMNVAKALNGEIDPAILPPREADAFRQLRRLTDTDLKMRQKMAGEPIVSRRDYLPSAHKFGENPEGSEAAVLNRADRGDPRQMERDNFAVKDPEQLRTGFEAMGKNLGRQVDRNIIHDSLGDLLDHPEVKKLFDQHIGATGNKRTDWEKVKDGWLKAVGYPRAAVVSLTPRHGANILDLVANAVDPQHVPAVMKDTMALAAKLVKATPKEYENLTKEGRLMGAQAGQFTERKPFFQTIPGTKIPLDLPGKIPEGIPLIGGRKVGLGAWSRANNKIVWAIDEAAKQTLAKHLQSIGELNPGAKASARLVDYSNTSPLVKALKWVAPFGSFRGSIPGAVLGGVARNPAAAAFKNRATGGLFFGDKPDQGQPGIETFNPTADVGRIFNYGQQGQGRFKRIVSGLGDYVRGSLGAPPQAALGAAQDIAAPGGSDPRWAMRGQTWLPRYNKAGKLDLGFVVDSALGGVPEAQAMLEAAGIGRYQWAGLGKELLNQSTGVSIK